MEADAVGPGMTHLCISHACTSCYRCRRAGTMVKMTRMMTLLAVLCACLGAGADIVRVSAAISLKEALGEAAQAYKMETGGEIEFNFASSGQLASQIRNGAPVDVFISAADEQMEQLEKLKLIVSASRRILVSNRLVLIVPADAKDQAMSFEELAAARVKSLAMGDPRTVPAGIYARQVLTALKLVKAVEAKAVY